jgi:hypothetical protein
MFKWCAVLWLQVLLGAPATATGSVARAIAATTPPPACTIAVSHRAPLLTDFCELRGLSSRLPDHAGREQFASSMSIATWAHPMTDQMRSSRAALPACTGPSGSAGHCSDKCCPAATDVCVTNYDVDNDNCCALRQRAHCSVY